MPLGKPVAFYIREDNLQFIPSQMRADMPFIRVASEAFKEDLRRALKMLRYDLLQLASEADPYVEKWYSPTKIAEQIKED